MARSRTALLRFLVTLVAFTSAADALAQLGGGFPGGGGFGSGMGRSRGGANRNQEAPRQRLAETQAVPLEQVIEELRVDLKLEPTQVPAWETYVGKARLLASDIARERSFATASTQSSALKLIDRSVDAARNRLAALEDLSDTARALYSLLRPEQRLVADPRLAALVSGQREAGMRNADNQRRQP